MSIDFKEIASSKLKTIEFSGIPLKVFFFRGTKYEFGQVQSCLGTCIVTTFDNMFNGYDHYQQRVDVTIIVTKKSSELTHIKLEYFKDDQLMKCLLGREISQMKLSEHPHFPGEKVYYSAQVTGDLFSKIFEIAETKIS